MPFIRSITFKRYTLLAIFISLDREIMSPYSCYAKKGLVYIAIIDFSSRQSSSYTKCIKLNTRALYNMRLISLNKYTFLCYARCCTH